MIRLSVPFTGIPARLRLAGRGPALRQLTAQDFEDERTLLNPSKYLVFQCFFS